MRITADSWGSAVPKFRGRLLSSGGAVPDPRSPSIGRGGVLSRPLPYIWGPFLGFRDKKSPILRALCIYTYIYIYIYVFLGGLYGAP